MPNRPHARTTVLPMPPTSLTPVPPLPTHEGELELGALRAPGVDLFALVPTDPIRSNRDLALRRRVNTFMREVLETVDRADETRSRMRTREQELRICVARVTDQVSAIHANIALREAVLPLQIEAQQEELHAHIRALRGESAGAIASPATDEFERLWVADDDLSIAARTAVVNATNGITQDTASSPYNSYAGVVFANAKDRLRHHDRAVRETFLTLRSQLEASALGDDVQRAAARTLEDRTQEERRAAGLGSIMSGLRGMAGANGS
ncbi:MAG TPA: hypothetical protein VFN10_19495 [Thermoanaerobaculia bacterium]|nr:hypothetical protein [Thermoanaerobaculia bacterium]